MLFNSVSYEFLRSAGYKLSKLRTKGGIFGLYHYWKLSISISLSIIWEEYLLMVNLTKTKVAGLDKGNEAGRILSNAHTKYQ